MLAESDHFRYKSEESYMREKLGKLFEVQTVLYDVGARNFLFIDVPPLHRTPAAGQSLLSLRYISFSRAMLLISSKVGQKLSEKRAVRSSPSGTQSLGNISTNSFQSGRM